MLPKGRPELAFPFHAIVPALVAAVAAQAPSFGWGLAYAAVAFLLFGLAAMRVELACGNRSGVVSVFLDACQVPAMAMPFALIGGYGSFFLLLLIGLPLPRGMAETLFGKDLMTIPAGCAVLAAHLGAVEMVRTRWRARPLDPKADRAASPENVWTPNEGVRALDGDALPKDEVFFAAPPPEIGPVLCAGSTLRADVAPPTARDAAVYPGLLAAVMGTAGAAAAFVLTWGDVRVSLTFLALSVLLAFWEVWRLACPKHLCAFVGCDGAVRYTMRYPAGEIVPDRAVLFADAVHAYAGETSRPPYGRWYDYRWTDSNGHEFVRFWGERSEADRSVALPVRFARAAYRAWLLVHRERLSDTYRTTGKLAFPIKGGGAAELDDGGLTLAYGRCRYRATWTRMTREWRNGSLVLGGLEPEDAPGSPASVTVPGDAIADRDLLDEFVGRMIRNPA